MSEDELTRKTLRDWCGSEDVADSATLAALWNRVHGSGFLPDGAGRLIAAVRAAFLGRDDKRRIIFLRVTDFQNQGWRLVSVADFVRFVTAHAEDRVSAVLQGWSGVADIPDTSVSVCSLWAVNHGVACSFGIPDLIDRLAKEFRELQIALIPADFAANGDIQTVDDLIGAVAGSPSKPGGDE
jgi:hypothetical protein